MLIALVFPGGAIVGVVFRLMSMKGLIIHDGPDPEMMLDFTLWAIGDLCVVVRTIRTNRTNQTFGECKSTTHL